MPFKCLFSTFLILLSLPILATEGFSEELSEEEVMRRILELEQRLESETQKLVKLKEALNLLREETENFIAYHEQHRDVPRLPRRKSTAAEKATSGVPAPDKEVTLYGYIKTDAIYNTQTLNDGDVGRWVEPKGEGGSDDDFNLTAKQTRIGVNLKGGEYSGLGISGTVETDFFGNTSANSSSPRIRLAYADLQNKRWNFRLGQDWETQQIFIPKTVNFATLGNSGALWGRRPQIRASRTWDLENGESLITKVAATRTIGRDIDTGGQDDGADSGIPTTEWNIHYKGKKTYHSSPIVGLSGHWGEERLDMEGLPHKAIPSWSVIASAGGDISADILFESSFWYGTNLDNYQGTIGNGINEETLAGIDGYGGWMQLAYYPSEDLRLGLLAGADNPLDKDLSPGMRSLNRSGVVNAFYSLTSELMVGLEYQYLTTTYLEGTDHGSHRFQSAFYFYF